MREIKFRAWDKINRRILQNVSTGTITIWGEREESAKAKDCVFMQFTGLHDKNGVEIYEGDILGKRDVVEVVWHKAWWRVRSSKKNSDFTHDLDGYVQGVKPEVIGNIYENPELLK